MEDTYIAKKFLQKQQSCAARGISFKLSLIGYMNLMKAKKCYYTGIPLSRTEGAPDQLTIDRINHHLGYESGNVVACSLAFNQFKSTIERDKLIFLPGFQRAVAKMFREANKRNSQAAKTNGRA